MVLQLYHHIYEIYKIYYGKEGTEITNQHVAWLHSMVGN